MRWRKPTLVQIQPGPFSQYNLEVLMEQYEYLLTVRVPLKALDDPDARSKALKVLADADIPGDNKVKLQRLEKGKEPTGIKL